jgi:CRISPR-associated protein Csb2
VWRSVTPVVHERRTTIDLAEVRRWFEHAGHPVPVSFRAMHAPFVTGGAHLRPSHLRPRYGQHRFGHIEVTFDRPVAGPLVVGRGRQFGMGLLAPVDDPDVAAVAR